MNKFSMLCPIVLITAIGYCGDVIYTEANKPADTTSVVVSGGTSTMSGVQVFRQNLKRHWTFDVEDSLLKDSVAESLLSSAHAPMYSTDAKFGAGAVATGYLKNEERMAAGLQLVSLPDFVTADGSRPFTVSFWFKTTNTVGNAARRIFYFGPPAGGSGLGADQFLDFMYGTNPSGKTAPNGWRCFNSKMSATFAKDPENRWVNVVLVCEPGETSGQLSVTVYIDGDLAKTHAKNFNAGEAPIMILGSGYSATSTPPVAVYDTLFDEFMLFDSSLTADEVSCVYASSRPYEFSAGWDIESDGILDIYGCESHQVRGTGKVTTDSGLKLAGNDGIFHGEVSGAGLTICKNPSKTQILTKPATYDGVTMVQSGALKIDPALNVSNIPDFCGTLIAYYPFDDIETPGRDYSGNGNHLTDTTTDFRGGVIWSVDATGPGSMTYDSAGPADQCLSVAQLKGFGEGVNADTAFVVGAWVCLTNIVNKEGFFSAGGGTCGFRFNGTSNKRWYFGDCNSAASIEIATPKSLYGTWVHLAVVYNYSAASGKQQLYYNGECKSSTDTLRSGVVCHGAGKLCIGSGYAVSDLNHFGGRVDEVFVLKLKDGETAEEIAADVQKMMNHRHADGGGVFGHVLPLSTKVSVAEDTLIEITNSVEEVTGISGMGRIVIDGGASLAVSDGGTIENADVFGGVMGDGTLTFGSDLVWSLTDASLGKHQLFEVPTAFNIDSAASATWRVKGAEKRVLSWAVKEGRLTLEIAARGLMIIFR